MNRYSKRSNRHLNPDYTFDSYVVGPANRLACAAAYVVATAQEGNLLFIVGGVGAGKTHLMQAVGNHVTAMNPARKIRYATSSDLIDEFIAASQSGSTSRVIKKYSRIGLLMLDDIQILDGRKRMQIELGNLFRTIIANQGLIVLAGGFAPQDAIQLAEVLFSGTEPGLVQLEHPDLETRIAILHQKCNSMNLHLPAGIVDYVAGRIPRDIRSLEGALARLDFYLSQNGRYPDQIAMNRLLSDLFDEETASGT